MKHTYDMVVSSAGAYADPDSRYGRFYTANGAANYFAGGYHNDEIDKLLEQGRVLSDPDARKPLYRHIEEIIQREMPHVILYIAPAAYAWSNRLQDLRIGDDGAMAISDGGLAQAWLKS
jgi:peptide/nickel transport system substrate-binding protein